MAAAPDAGLRQPQPPPLGIINEPGRNCCWLIAAMQALLVAFGEPWWVQVEGGLRNRQAALRDPRISQPELELLGRMLAFRLLYRQEQARRQQEPPETRGPVECGQELEKAAREVMHSEAGTQEDVAEFLRPVGNGVARAAWN